MSGVRKFGPLVVARGKGLAWFRLFGVGVSWTDHRQHPALLSERMSRRGGFRDRRRLHVGPHCFLVTTESHP